MVDDVTVGDDEPTKRVEHHAGAEGVNFVRSRERDSLARLATLHARQSGLPQRTAHN
jgi:hypothetical protein